MAEDKVSRRLDFILSFIDFYIFCMRAVKALARLRDTFANRSQDNCRNHAWIQKVFSEERGSNFFLVNQWIQNTTKIGPSSDRQRNAI